MQVVGFWYYKIREGVSYDNTEAAILLLHLNSNHKSPLSSIVDEQFSSLEDLNYYRIFKYSEKELTQNKYINVIQSIGLTYSKQLAVHYLTQALHSLDLTSENLFKLTTDHIDLNKLKI